MLLVMGLDRLSHYDTTPLLCMCIHIFDEHYDYDSWYDDEFDYMIIIVIMIILFFLLLLCMYIYIHIYTYIHT